MKKWGTTLPGAMVIRQWVVSGYHLRNIISNSHLGGKNIFMYIYLFINLFIYILID